MWPLLFVGWSRWVGVGWGGVVGGLGWGGWVRMGWVGGMGGVGGANSDFFLFFFENLLNCNNKFRRSRGICKRIYLKTILKILKIVKILKILKILKMLKISKKNMTCSN
jgi:hypothetical protein